MNNNNKKSTAKKLTSAIMAIALVVAFVLLVSMLFQQPVVTPKYYEFLEDVEQGEISAVYFSGNYTVQVLTKEDLEENNIDISKFPNSGTVSYSLNVPSRLAAEQAIKESIAAGEAAGVAMDIYVDFDKPDAVSLWSYLPYLLIFGGGLILVLVMFNRANSQNNQSINFGKSKARISTNVKVRFTDVAGAEEEKEELKEIIDFLKDPAKFNKLGARIPKGVLLVGPPGTGKTLFAKAVAGEAGVPFFSISGSDFVEMFVGVGAGRVRDLFEQAKKNLPCIIFIDEIDAVGRHRGAGLGGGNDEREQTLNQLLVEMDGFTTNSGIIIMAATNRSDILDPALMRPGRFDRQVFVNRPDVRGREAILKVHSRNKPLSKEVDLKIIARMTHGFVGADLENLLNEAAIFAARESRSVIMMQDITEGINKVLMGPQKKSRLVTETDKRITAYHEAGHAILGAKLKHCDTVQEVTIIPRGNAGGYTLSRPSNDDEYTSKAKMIDYITMALGGRVAEELVIQNVTTGASGDIKQLTSIAHSMVAKWGMSDVIGPIYYGDDDQVFVGKSYQTKVGYSEKMAGIIDEEANKIIIECLERARKILGENLECLNNMARVLLEKETINTKEVEMLLEGKSAKEVMEYMDEQEAIVMKQQEEQAAKAKAEAERAAAEAAAKIAAKAAEMQRQAEQESQQPLDHNKD